MKDITPCRGCVDNYYNQAGNSTTGQCWLLEHAKLVERTRVGILDNPPYEWIPVEIYHCNRPKGYVYLKREDVRIRKESGAT